MNGSSQHLLGVFDGKYAESLEGVLRGDMRGCSVHNNLQGSRNAGFRFKGFSYCWETIADALGHSTFRFRGLNSTGCKGGHDIPVKALSLICATSAAREPCCSLTNRIHREHALQCMHVGKMCGPILVPRHFNRRLNLARVFQHNHWYSSYAFYNASCSCFATARLTMVRKVGCRRAHCWETEVSA